VAYYGTGHPVRVPTLLMQGSVDALFNLNDAYANFKHVQSQGAPAKLIAFCGGHVSCPSDYNDGGARDHLDAAILTWFARYLRQQSVNTGALVEFSTQDGIWHNAGRVPTVTDPGISTVAKATGAVNVVNSGLPTSGPGGSDSIDPVVTDAPSGGEPGTGTIPVLTAAKDTTVFGIPHATVAVSGTGAGTHLFFKLVDREANRVLDLQAESLRVDGPLLPGQTQTFSIDLVGIAYRLPTGHHLDLQISTSSLAHVAYRGPAAVTAAVTVAVPIR
jgi:ABC-2 type transport system ATP-binding protein